MSDIYIKLVDGGFDYRETDEPAARQVSRQAIAERERERTERRLRRLCGAAWFVTGIVVGLLSAALLLGGGW